MKISICSFTGFKSLNGSNLRLFFLARELIKRGNTVKFIAPGKGDAESCERRFGTEAEDVGLNISRFQESKIKKYPVFSLKASRKIDKNSDLVFGQSLPSAMAVKLSRTKGRKVLDYVDLWSEYWIYAHRSIKARMVYQGLKNAERMSVKGISLVFTITEKLKEMIEKRGCDPMKIRVVRDGVDTRAFKPLKVKDSFYSKYNLEKGGYITYQGGIAVWDGVQFLLDAAPLVLRENPDTKFLIVGDGPYVPILKEQIRKLKIQDSVIFTGWVPYSDMPSFMNISKINIVSIPDVRAMQGVLTLKLFEAMACGLPTVISDLPGVREHMKHLETAYLVKSENRGELARGITELLQNRHLHNRIRRNGLKMIPHYDWRKIAGDMADLML